MVTGTATDSLAQTAIQSGLGDEWLRLGAVKVFSDGSLGAFTAALDAPYEGRAKERGMFVHPPPSFGRPWRRPIGRGSRPRPTRSGMRPCASSRRRSPRVKEKIRGRR